MIDARAGVAAIYLSITGAAGFLIMPVILGAAVTEFDLSDSAVGYLASMLMAGSVVAALSALFWARTVDWRLAARVALFAQGAVLLMLSLADGFVPVMVLFMLVSLGGGAVYSLALTVLSDHSQSDRMFGFSIAGQVSFQVLGLVLLGLFTSAGGFDLLMWCLTAMVVTGIVFSLWLPAGGHTGEQFVLADVFRQRSAGSALLGCLFFFFNVGCVWAYIERIGNAAEFSPERLGLGLAIGVSVGVIGALAASWQAARFGRLAPLTAATVGTVISVLFLRPDVEFLPFMLAVSVYNFFWNYSLAYQYAVVASVDQSGRCVAVTPAFHAAGAAIGPAIAASHVMPGQYVAVNMLAIAAVIVSMLFFAPAARVSGQA